MAGMIDSDWKVAFRLKFHFAASKLRSQVICLHNLGCEIKCEIRIDQLFEGSCLLFNGIKKNRDHIIHLVTKMARGKGQWWFRMISIDFNLLTNSFRILCDRSNLPPPRVPGSLRPNTRKWSSSARSCWVLPVTTWLGSQRSSNLWNVGSWFRKWLLQNKTRGSWRRWIDVYGIIIIIVICIYIPIW